jgi:hypothetical protein
MRTHILLPLAAAALAAGTTLATAQGYVAQGYVAQGYLVDDPPGSNFQTRGFIENVLGQQAVMTPRGYQPYRPYAYYGPAYYGPATSALGAAGPRPRSSKNRAR